MIADARNTAALHGDWLRNEVAAGQKAAVFSAHGLWACFALPNAHGMLFEFLQLSCTPQHLCCACELGQVMLFAKERKRVVSGHVDEVYQLLHHGQACAMTSGSLTNVVAERVLKSHRMSWWHRVVMGLERAIVLLRPDCCVL